MSIPRRGEDLETKFLTPHEMFLMRLNGENRLNKLKKRWVKQNAESRLRRGRLEITAQILLFCGELKLKTNIMYKTNLNYTHLKRQLSDLTSQGLLLEVGDKYVTSEKGHHFLSLFAGICNLVDE